MAAASEGEDDSFWPGYVDALTAMVKVLTLIMMLLGVVVFSLSQNISRVILLKVAEAAQITPREGQSIGELADQVIEAIKRRSEPSSSAVVAGADAVGRGTTPDRGAPPVPSVPPPSPSAAAPASPAATAEPSAASSPSSASPSPSTAPAPMAPTTAVVQASPPVAPVATIPTPGTPAAPVTATPAEQATTAPAPSAPSQATAAPASSVDGSQPTPAGAAPGPEGVASGPSPEARPPAPAEQAGKVAPDRPQAPMASPAPTEAATKAASQDVDSTIVSERPADFAIPVSGASAAQATAVISIRFQDQATRLDDAANAKLRSVVAENEAFSKARIVEVRGQASLASGSITDARRIAYQRVLVVRNELLASGLKADTLRLKIEDTMSPVDGNLVRVLAGQ